MKIKILYLYSEVMGYTMATINELISSGCEVHVVYWDEKKLTPYKFDENGDVFFYKRSELTVNKMNQLGRLIDPDVVVVSGWMDWGYVIVSFYLRLRKKIVVACFDDIWFANLKQLLGSVLGFFGVFKLFFSHAWVTGIYQYEYAIRLGFMRKNVIYNLYSADVKLFHKELIPIGESRKHVHPKKFIFVGRFERIKGVELLIKAWEMIGDSRAGWELILVGNGSLKINISKLEIDGLVVKDFMQPEKLAEILNEIGCFILPSTFEPWGVVVHEFASAGVPLILSDAVGAGTEFLISDLNGYRFKSGNVLDLKNCLLKIIHKSDVELMEMSKVSQILSHRISPLTSAANLISLVD